MANSAGKRIIIDACIARSASNSDPGAPAGAPSRRFLIGVLEYGHIAAMTNDLLVEWKNHESRFARLWRVGMTQRGRVKLLGAVRHSGLAKNIIERFSDDGIKALVAKDMHLAQGAWDADRIVASLERTLRDHLRDACTDFNELRMLTWVNPNLEPDIVAWLERGAPAEPERVL